MKLFKIFGLASVLAFTTTVMAQNDPVIMTVNDKPVHKSEFEAIFRKNNKDGKVTKESLDEYMELFINFKLKVTEAEELGLDTARKFKDELSGYRKQLARPYLVDNQLTDDLVKEAYDRLQWEVRASHVLYKCDWEADPKDSLAAYNKAMAARAKILKANGDIGKIASMKEGSDDPSALKNKGDLGWFTAFQMVYFFESTCYNMKVGDVSMPVRTRYGYHIIKLTGKRPARGTIKVAHILVGAKDTDNADTKATAKKKADEIHARLLKGENFGTLATQFSEDPSSNRKNGELAPFSTGKMVDEFEDAAFALEKDGDISPVVQTMYGYHIIKRIELKPNDSFETLKNQLKQKVQRDSRSYLPKKSFINKLKEKYNFREEKMALFPFYSVIDTNVFYGAWDTKKAAHLNSRMFEFAGKVFTQKDFTEFIGKNQRRSQSEDLNVFINNKYENFVSNSLMDYEDSRLEELYPEFRMLMKEYRDGILLFELTDQKVWTKAVKDTLGLRAFYDDHKKNYMWPKRYDISVYYCATEDIAKQVKKDIAKKTTTDKMLFDKYNKESQLNLKIVHGILPVDDNDILKKYTPEKAGTSKFIKENDQVVILKTHKILEPMPKTIPEAKGVITSDYQNSLEKNWLESLRAKYKVVVNKDVLYSIK